MVERYDSHARFTQISEIGRGPNSTSSYLRPFLVCVDLYDTSRLELEQFNSRLSLFHYCVVSLVTFDLYNGWVFERLEKHESGIFLTLRYALLLLFSDLRYYFAALRNRSSFTLLRVGCTFTIPPVESARASA